MKTRTSTENATRLLVAMMIGALLAWSLPASAQEDGGSEGGSANVTVNDDLHVEGRVCASDSSLCDEPTESFSSSPGGFNTELKLKDTNGVNIWFADTDTAASDWSIGCCRAVIAALGIYNDVGDVPFRVEQGAADGLMQLTDQGVGIGTDSPQRLLHVNGDTGGQSVVKATHTGADDALRTVFSIENFGPPSFTLIDTSPGAPDWFFRGSQSGPFAISTNATGVTEMLIAPGGNVTIAGTLTQSSSAATKHDVAVVDTAAVLSAVRDLDVSTWSYDSEPGVTHMGPMSEDFADAFGLGATTSGIAAVDADGVALAAIQALADQNTALAGENAELRAQLAELTDRVAALEPGG